jgi:3-oxoacyl-[acyl-carrier protein] reductase
MDCALVTGASKGIGRSIAVQLAKDQGLHVLVNYNSDLEGAEQTRKKIEADGGSAEIIHFDVSAKKNVDEVLDEWQKSNPEKFIRVLVNNAGVTKDGWFMWMDEANWDKVLNVSLKGMYNVTHHVLRKMLHEKKGRIVNISSLSGMKGVAGQANYSAAKAGMIGATKALAQEVARMNITVNAVAPGFVETDMLQGPEIDKYIRMIPAGRVAQPEEIAHLVSFLASDKAAYITGEAININGGIYS